MKRRTERNLSKKIVSTQQIRIEEIHPSPVFYMVAAVNYLQSEFM